MHVSPQDLTILLREVEQEDPIDFADLPFPEEDLRAIVVTSLCEMAQKMEDLTTDEQIMTLLASAAKLVLENLVLQARLLTRDGLPIESDVNELMERLRGSRGG